MGEGVDALLLLDEVLDVYLVLDVLDICLARVAVLVAQGGELVLEDTLYLFRVRQEALVIGDTLLELGVFLFQLLAVKTLECFEAHIEDGLGLYLVQAEAGHEVFPGVVIALADDTDDLVYIVLGNEQALEEVLALPGLSEVILRAPGDELLLEGEIFVNDVPQGEDLGLGLVVHQGEHVDGEGGLQLGLSEEAVQNDLCIGVLLYLDDDAHTVAVRLVAQAGDALEALVADLVGYVLYELALVDLVGQLGDDDAVALMAVFLDLGPGADDDLSSAGGVGGADAAAAHDDALCREIRAFYVFHKVGEPGLRIVQDADAGVDDLG